jgi:hypothetical protein
VGIIVQTRRIVAALGAAALLAACSGTVGHSASPGFAVLPQSRVVPDDKVTVTIRIHVPPKIKGRQFWAYLSKGLALVFNPLFGTFAFNLTPINRQQCVGTPLVCTATLRLQPRVYTVKVNAYTKAPVNGSIPPDGGVIAGISRATLAVTSRGAIADVVLGGESVRLTPPAGSQGATISASGGSGGQDDGSQGVPPGSMTGTIAFASTDVLTVTAGGSGYLGLGGFNGGGKGFPQAQGFDAGGGGGASDVRIGGTALSNRVLVAGGSGGNAGADAGLGGRGGGIHGAPGQNGDHGTAPGYGGFGGTQNAGGVGGVAGGNLRSNGKPGVLGVGGAGGAHGMPGGGGGGGYYGGGGGGSSPYIPGQFSGAGGGGGGSSFVETSGKMLWNARVGGTGDGVVFVVWKT